MSPQRNPSHLPDLALGTSPPSALGEQFCSSNTHLAIPSSSQASARAGKLPLGAMVSPLSPFFSERAKQCTLETAKARALDEALSSAQPARTRTRSASHGSQDSDTSSVSSSDSFTSGRSIATAISSIDEAELPATMPKISYSEWSKFGISLFTPKLANPHSQMYYHYPATPHRSRSKSAVPRRAFSDSLLDGANCHTSSDHMTSPPKNARPPLRSTTIGRFYTSY